jgi:hypothetical protein
MIYVAILIFLRTHLLVELGKLLHICFEQFNRLLQTSCRPLACLFYLTIRFIHVNTFEEVLFKGPDTCLGVFR